MNRIISLRALYGGLDLVSRTDGKCLQNGEQFVHGFEKESEPSNSVRKYPSRSDSSEVVPLAIYSSEATGRTFRSDSSESTVEIKYGNMTLYQTAWPRKSMRSCFFEIHPYMDHNISLVDEFNDPTGQPILPPVVLNEPPPTNIIAGIVNDSVLQSESQAARIEELPGLIVAIEASWYLQNIIDIVPGKEPLLAALGGLPYWLKVEIEYDLEQWNRVGWTPVFIFDGLSIIGQEEMSLRTAKEANLRTEEAWALYCIAKTPDRTRDAVTAFGTSGAIQPKILYQFFQEILFERGLRYEIASHSACAHMAYLEKHPLKSGGDINFQAIMGSAELLLYDLDQSFITKIDFNRDVFWAISKTTLPSKLNVSEETLANALLMTGTSFLPAFPVLKDGEIIKQQPFTITDAINMYRTANKSMISLCDTWNEILQKQEPNWSDKYRKAKMAIKHNIHVADGDPSRSNGGACLMVTEYNRLTGDHHEYIGLQLPEELYHYLIHGNIGRRIMNWLTYLEILVRPPLSGGDTIEYRRLVTQDLIPIQSQSIALYTARMHRAFQHKDFIIRFWFDNSTTVVVKHGTAQPAPNRLAETWRVKCSSYGNRSVSTGGRPGSFSFALLTLQDAAFAKSTIARDAEVSGLRSQSDILSNTIWRLLHLRGYVNDAHRPTAWGKAVTATFTDLSEKNLSQLEEAAFLAFELLRLGQLNVRARYDEWIGAPQRGSDLDKSHCLLIGRCACLLKLRHKMVGYTGPLSKNLLAYHSIIAAVRVADRDLVEAIVSSMFMFAHADRRQARDDDSNKNRKRVNSDWIKLGFSLPFGRDIDIGLGIAVKTYLDDYSKPYSTKQEIEMNKARYVAEQLPDSEDFSGDVEMALDFFTSLYSGVKALGSIIPAEDAAIWDGAANYLYERRLERPDSGRTTGTPGST